MVRVDIKIVGKQYKITIVDYVIGDNQLDDERQSAR